VTVQNPTTNLSFFPPKTSIPIFFLINPCTIYHSLYLQHTGNKSYRCVTRSAEYLHTKFLYTVAEYHRNSEVSLLWRIGL
jgi:hypothetical protein